MQHEKIDKSIKNLLRMKTYYFEIISPDKTKVLKKKYKAQYQGQAYDKLNEWFGKHNEYEGWETKFKGESYL